MQIKKTKVRLRRFVILFGICAFILANAMIAPPAVMAAQHQVTYEMFDHSEAALAPILPGGKTLAAKFAVTKGAMNRLTFVEMPTWDTAVNSFQFDVYKWDSTYGITLSGKPVFTKTITNHVNGNDCVITFDQPLKSDRYLWTITKSVATDANGNASYGVSPWRTEKCPEKGIICYENGAMIDTFYKFSIDVTYNDSDKELEPEVIKTVDDIRYDTIKLYGGNFLAPIIPTGRELASKFTVSRGQLLSLIFEEMPTWDTTVNSFTFQLYAWLYDYDYTLTQKPVYEITIENHKNGSNCEITFPEPLAAGRYLWCILDSTSENEDGTYGNGVAPWTAETCPVEGVTGYVDGEELIDQYYRVIINTVSKDSDQEIGPEGTRDPATLPTPTPTPTEKPEETSPSPQKTTPTDKSKGSGGDSKGLVIGLIAAGVIAAAIAAVIIFVIRKRKK